MANKNDIFTKHGHCHPHCGHSEFLVTDNLLGEFQFMSAAERKIARDNLGITDMEIQPLTISALDEDGTSHDLVFDGSKIKHVEFYSEDDSVRISVEDEHGEMSVNLVADTKMEFEDIKKLIEDNGYELVSAGSIDYINNYLHTHDTILVQHGAAIEGVNQKLEEHTAAIEEAQDTANDAKEDAANAQEKADEADKKADEAQEKADETEKVVIDPTEPEKPSDVYYLISECKITLIPNETNNVKIDITYNKYTDGKAGEKVNKSIVGKYVVSQDNTYAIQDVDTTIAKLHLKNPVESTDKKSIELESVEIIKEGENSVLVKSIVFDSPKLEVSKIELEAVSERDNVTLEIKNASKTDSLTLKKIVLPYSFLYKTIIPKEGSANFIAIEEGNFWYCTNQSMLHRMADNDDKLNAVTESVENELKATKVNINKLSIILKKPASVTSSTKPYEYVEKLSVIYSISGGKRKTTLITPNQYIAGANCYYGIVDDLFAIGLTDFQPTMQTIGKVAVYGKDSQFLSDKCKYEFSDIAVSVLDVYKYELFDGDDGEFNIGKLAFQSYTGKTAVHYDTNLSDYEYLNFSAGGEEWSFSSSCSVPKNTDHLIVPVTLDITGTDVKNRWLCVNDTNDVKYKEDEIQEIITNIYNS